MLLNPEIITGSIVALVFGSSLIPTALRIRSREKVVLYLLLYLGLGFLLACMFQDRILLYFGIRFWL